MQSVLDVQVFASLWEGTPLTVFEAMAMRRPIVSTTVDGPRRGAAPRRERAAGSSPSMWTSSQRPCSSCWSNLRLPLGLPRRREPTAVASTYDARYEMLQELYEELVDGRR